MLGVKNTKKTLNKYTTRSLTTGYQPFCCATKDKFVYPIDAWCIYFLFFKFLGCSKWSGKH